MGRTRLTDAHEAQPEKALTVLAIGLLKPMYIPVSLAILFLLYIYCCVIKKLARCSTLHICSASEVAHEDELSRWQIFHGG